MGLDSLLCLFGSHSLALSLSLSPQVAYVCPDIIEYQQLPVVYMGVYVCVCVCICIYIYIAHVSWHC